MGPMLTGEATHRLLLFLPPPARPSMNSRRTTSSDSWGSMGGDQAILGDVVTRIEAFERSRGRPGTRPRAIVQRCTDLEGSALVYRLAAALTAGV